MTERETQKERNRGELEVALAKRGEGCCLIMTIGQNQRLSIF
jgi:hypothetical protein